jgi:hypothetical protein
MACQQSGIPTLDLLADFLTHERPFGFHQYEAAGSREASGSSARTLTHQLQKPFANDFFTQKVG